MDLKIMGVSHLVAGPLRLDKVGPISVKLLNLLLVLGQCEEVVLLLADFAQTPVDRTGIPVDEFLLVFVLLAAQAVETFVLGFVDVTILPYSACA